MLYSLIKTFLTRYLQNPEENTNFCKCYWKETNFYCLFCLQKDNKSVKGVRTWQKESKSLRLVEAAVTPPS